MKIIVNKCYGGWSLSDVAIKRFLELQGKECFFYEQTKYKHADGKDECTRLNTTDKVSFSYTVTKDLGETIDKFPSNDHVYINSEFRANPLLIQVIEELGEEASSGRLSKLRIVEIPDGVDWEIDEYDGIETIHEKHRIW